MWRPRLMKQRSPGFESGISHTDPDALQDHCVIMQKNLRVEREKPTAEAKKYLNKNIVNLPSDDISNPPPPLLLIIIIIFFFYDGESMKLTQRHLYGGDRREKCRDRPALYRYFFFRFFSKPNLQPKRKQKGYFVLYPAFFFLLTRTRKDELRKLNLFGWYILHHTVPKIIRLVHIKIELIQAGADEVELYAVQ